MQKNIVQVSKQAASQLGFLLIDVNFRGNEKDRVIEIYIDNQSGISTEDCAKMSNEVAAKIDETNLISSNYRLDVSSPGADRSLKFLEQYPKHLNRKFEIKYEDNEEMKKAIGKLEKIEDDNLFLNLNNQITIIKFEKIKSAKVILSF